jgi:ATP-dependent DNA helicase RecG
MRTTAFAFSGSRQGAIATWSPWSEFLGTRQSGWGDFRLANLVRDARILMAARKEAQDWLEKDPELKSTESASMREVLLERWGQRLQLGAVG